MPMVDPFSGDAFTMGSLTRSINILPNLYGRTKEMGIFRTQGYPTRIIYVEEQNGVLNLLPTMPPGSPGTVGKKGKRTVRPFTVSHIPHDDVILPESYEGVRAFGSDNALIAVSQLVTDRLQAMKNKHDITHEYHRMGALQGVIYDSDGSTVIANLFTEFGITKYTVDFLLGTDATDVKAKCRDVLRHIEDNLLGEIYNGVHAFVNSSFFDKLTNHSSVLEVFTGWSAAQEMLGNDTRKGFKFGGITFEEYRGTATEADGTSHAFIATDYGIAFPTGTANTFEFAVSPADFIETANTIGIPYYAKQELRKFERGIDLHTQSNVLPLCKRPGVLVEIKTSN